MGADFLFICFVHAGVAELADARDSKSRSPFGECRFDPDHRYFSILVSYEVVFNVLANLDYIVVCEFFDFRENVSKLIFIYLKSADVI